MFGSKKLALVVAAAAVWMGVEASAKTMSPFTDGTFYTYFSKDGSGGNWHRGATFLMHFVHWSQDNPEWTTKNISWVEKWSGAGGSLHRPDWRFDPETGDKIDDFVPPWKRPVNIPEPGTALATAGLLGLAALRRRTI